jgi:uncharacterized protein
VKRLVLVLFLVSCGGAAPASDAERCAGGDPHACLAQARSLFAANGQTGQAVTLMDGACKAGLGEACSELGLRFENGRGVAQDDAKAFQLFLAGDAAGDATSSASAGLMIVHGKTGPSADLAEAARLLGKGCDGQLDWACFKLGTAYSGGHLGEKDLPAALQAFEKACQLDNGDACMVSSQMLAHGQGGPTDEAQAAAFAKRACALGVARACG